MSLLTYGNLGLTYENLGTKNVVNISETDLWHSWTQVAEVVGTRHADRESPSLDPLVGFLETKRARAREKRQSKDRMF